MSEAKQPRLEARSYDEIKELVKKRLLLRTAYVVVCNAIKGGAEAELTGYRDSAYEFLFDNSAHHVVNWECKSFATAQKIIDVLVEEITLACKAFAEITGPAAFKKGDINGYINNAVQEVRKSVKLADKSKYQYTYLTRYYIHGSDKIAHHTLLHVPAADKALKDLLKDITTKQPKSIPPTYRSSGYGKDQEMYDQDIGHLYYGVLERVSEDTLLWFAKAVHTKAGGYEITGHGIRFTSVDSKVQYKDSGVALARKLRDTCERSGRLLLSDMLLDFDGCLASAGTTCHRVPEFPDVPIESALHYSEPYRSKVDFITEACLHDHQGTIEYLEDGSTVRKYDEDSFCVAISLLKSKAQYLESLYSRYCAKRARMAAQPEELRKAVEEASGHISLMPLFIKHVLEDECRRSELMLMTGLSFDAYREAENDDCDDEAGEGQEQDPDAWRPTHTSDAVAYLGDIAGEYQKMCHEPDFVKAFNSEIKKIVAASKRQ